MYCNVVWLRSELRATTAYTFSTSEPPKMVRTPSALDILTSKCASRHNGVHFFDISTSKSGPRTVCFVHFDLEMCTFSTSEPPKVFRAWCVLYILTWKCASRHNDVHFFNISTSKSGPELRCFVHFDFEMCFAPQRRALFDISTSKSGPRTVCFVHFDLETCFAPQRRALFRHLNLQKCSEHGVFCAFWLGNVLRATTARTFSTSQLPKVVRTWGVLYLLTWKCASRHNGVQFFISPLASWLRTRRFSEPTFRPSRATNHWKNTVFRDFPTFSRICIFFLLTLSLLIFSLLSASALLCFSSVHIVGSLTSKLPSLNFLR